MSDISKADALARTDEQSSISDEEIAKNVQSAVRKLDWLVLPIIGLIYMFSNLDKANIGNAYVAGMAKDTHLTANQYANVVSLLFVPYVIFETPASLFFKDIGARYLLSFVVFSFGAVSLATAWVSGYRSLMTCRMLIGLFEAGVIPSIYVYLGMAYSKSENGKRMAVVCSFGAVAGAFGGLLAYGLTHINSTKFAGWQWLFVVEGALTILLSPLVLIMLPNDPSSAWFFTEDEKTAMAHRFYGPGSKSEYQLKDKFDWKQIAKAFLELRLWLSYAYQFCVNLTLFGFSTFLPIIIRGMNFSATESQLLTVPVYFVSMIAFLITAYMSDRQQKRAAYLLFGSVFHIIGYIFLLASVKPSVRYFGCFCVAIGLYTSAALTCLWVSNNTAGHYKRAAATGLCNSIGCSSGVVVGHIYTTKSAPRYIKGVSVSLGLAVFGIFCLAGVSYMYYAENKKRKVLREKNPDESEAESLALGDMSVHYTYVI